MQPTFARVLRGELLKTKHTFGLTIALAGPLVVTLLVTIFFLDRGDRADGSTNPWNDFVNTIYNFYFLLYPLFAALIAFLLSNVEHKNRGFKQLFTIPAPKGYFYFGKVLILIGWLGASLLLAAGLIPLLGNLVNAIFPAYQFDGYELGIAAPVFLIRLFITLLSIVAIHFFMSLYWDNFIISVGAAAFLLIFGMVVAGRWEYAYLFPYSYPVSHYLEYRSGSEVWVDQKTWISLTYALVFFVAGFFLMARKNIK